MDAPRRNAGCHSHRSECGRKLTEAQSLMEKLAWTSSEEGGRRRLSRDVGFRRGADASHPASATAASTTTAGLSGIFQRIVLRCTGRVAEGSRIGRRRALEVRRVSVTVARDGRSMLAGCLTMLVGCLA